MLKKIKIILGILLFSTFLLGSFYVASPSRVKATQICTSQGCTDNGLTNACSGLTGNEYDKCTICYPELKGGSALTDAQRKSCVDCTDAKLDPDLTAAEKNQDASVTCLQKNIIVQDLNTIINLLSALVGIAVVGAIIMGGIQYSVAGANPDALSKARKRVINGITALFAFLFIWAFLQWIVPGGVF